MDAEGERMSYQQWLAALCIFRESRGSSAEVWNGIWWVINNRMNDAKRRWPRTIPGVILEHAQFSSFLQSDPNCVQFPIPTNPPSADWKAFQEICDTVVTVPPIGTDPVGGANMYQSMPEGQEPYWVKDATFTVAFGSVKFYILN